MNTESNNKSTEAKHVLADVLSTNTFLFGENLEYKKGDVVIWNGFTKAILIIANDFKVSFKSHVSECAKSTHQRYNSLHYSNLRLANEDEINKLSSSDIMLL